MQCITNLSTETKKKHKQGKIIIIWDVPTIKTLYSLQYTIFIQLLYMFANLY